MHYRIRRAGRQSHRVPEYLISRAAVEAKAGKNHDFPLTIVLPFFIGQPGAGAVLHRLGLRFQPDRISWISPARPA